MNAVQLLYEQPGLPSVELPAELSARYPGAIGFSGPCVVANFVSTVDGVVAICDVEGSNRLVSRGSEDDRLVMGLLRALADAVVVGTGTFHASPRSRWRPQGVYPPLADAYTQLRQQLGMPEAPEVVIVSGATGIRAGNPLLEEGALVIAPNEDAAKLLRAQLPGATSIEVAGGGNSPLVDVTALIRLLHDRGHQTLLSEAGPHLFGAMLAAGVVDELFLTISPQLAGRASGSERFGLVEEQSFLPARPAPLQLRSVRAGSDGDLLMRYGIAEP